MDVYSQVGIDSSAPKITLDGVGKPTQSVALNRIIASTITGAQLKTKTYISTERGAFVFITDTDTDTDTTLSDQAMNITSLGFNDEIWVKLGEGNFDITNVTFINNPSKQTAVLGNKYSVPLYVQ
ncbi:hypothetical protein CQ022_05385 [Chryseobacterium culicis]|uniref:Uncharacterized protein n=1 Tax=Chryseobacterium culicis TaxID=680127 RepID=A0A2S9CYZ8_CHRCI|nr:hypothetical protein CQ022_05385 [Chryseobacterium culicis]PRB90586.1 hypothetical protein CQ033_07600 [Chryseobacterium culicis]